MDSFERQSCSPANELRFVSRRAWAERLLIGGGGRPLRDSRDSVTVCRSAFGWGDCQPKASGASSTGAFDPNGNLDEELP